MNEETPISRAFYQGLAGRFVNCFATRFKGFVDFLVGAGLLIEDAFWETALFANLLLTGVLLVAACLGWILLTVLTADFFGAASLTTVFLTAMGLPAVPLAKTSLAGTRTTLGFVLEAATFTARTGLLSRAETVPTISNLPLALPRNMDSAKALSLSLSSVEVAVVDVTYLSENCRSRVRSSAVAWRP